jgi:hypothetical protein
MFIDPDSIIHKKFVVNGDPNVFEYECVGYSDGCGTILILGKQFDSTNNRTVLKSFKLTEIKFFGKV